MSCVCENTLVCLPTGLGKTHIAAVLIANFISWFPDKKVLFMAPTRPLVRQQVSALDGLRELVPEDLILEVSGQLAAKKREQLY
jgi:ERCC4-related helicase